MTQRMGVITAIATGLAQFAVSWLGLPEDQALAVRAGLIAVLIALVGKAFDFNRDGTPAAVAYMPEKPK